jgi:hypothetical protein
MPARRSIAIYSFIFFLQQGEKRAVEMVAVPVFELCARLETPRKQFGCTVLVPRVLGRVQKLYSLAGFSTGIILRTFSSGAHTGSWLNRQPSSIWSSGATSMARRPGTRDESGWGLSPSERVEDLRQSAPGRVA